MEYPAHRRKIVAISHLLRQSEDAMQHGGNDMGVGRLVFVNQAQGLFRVPFVHEDRPHAVSQGKRQIQRQRRGMVQGARNDRAIRCGVELRGLHHLLEQRGCGRRAPAIYAFRAAGRA